MTLTEIVQRFDGAKQTGPRKYQARCPCHQDKQPSMSITEDKGNVLVHCFAGCSTDDIVSAVGLTMADLFMDNNRQHSNTGSSAKQGNPILEATYSYAGGELRKQKFRKPDGSKYCTWQHRNGNSWAKGRNSIEPGLFQSDESLPNGKIVFVVEGEKDVLTLRKLGEAAVSLPDGCNSKWSPTYTQALSGRNIVILPDHDQAGEKYAQMVATNLCGVAASVRVVPLTITWPDAPPKSDITDLLDAKGEDGARSYLSEAITSDEWEPPSGSDSEDIIAVSLRPRASVVSAADLDKMELPPVGWVAKGLIPQGVTALVAASKMGKSWMVLDLLLCVAAGRPFMGAFTTKSEVLYLALEDSLNRLQIRMRRLLGGDPVPDGFYFSTEWPTMDNGFFDEIENFLSKHPEVKVVCVDTMQKIRGAPKYGEGAYQTDYREAGQLKKFFDDRGVSLILLHHTRKAKDEGDPFDRISGTTGIMGALDTAMVLLKERRDDEIATLHITGRDVDQQSITVQFDRERCRWQSLGSADWFQEKRRREAYEQNPLVKTIRHLLASNQAAEWTGSASDLMKLGREITGQYLAPSAQRLGYLIRDLTPQMLELDGIHYDRQTHGTSSGKHRFYRFVTDESELPPQEELPFTG